MKNIIISIKLFIILSIIVCLIYPIITTGIATIIFPEKSKGSLIFNKNNEIIGSELIGQNFSNPKYFWGRPSAINNNPMPSGGSNLNPIGEYLKTQIQERIDSISKYNQVSSANFIPKDLLFSSASGVDPHISQEAAYFQIDRIIKYRNFNENNKNELLEIIKNSIEEPQFFFMGERRINILELNIKLDKIK